MSEIVHNASHLAPDTCTLHLTAQGEGGAVAGAVLAVGGREPLTPPPAPPVTPPARQTETPQINRRDPMAARRLPGLPGGEE